MQINRPTAKWLSSFSTASLTVPVEIIPLRDCPELLPLLAEWHHREWRKYSPSSTLDKRHQRLQQHLNQDPFPETFVALQRGRLLGSASLVFYHFGPHTPREPWLSNVYVRETERCRGIGSALVTHAENYVARQGFEAIKLFTVDKSAFYKRRGWVPERKARMSGYEVDIMGLALGKGDG